MSNNCAFQCVQCTMDNEDYSSEIW